MSFTPNFNFETPARGSYEGEWDIPVNENFRKIDTALFGMMTFNRSYSMPVGLDVGSPWFDLNWNVLKLKKRNNGSPSDYVKMLDEESFIDIGSSVFIEKETLSPPVPINLSLTPTLLEVNGITYTFTATWDDISSSYSDFDSYLIKITGTNVGNTTVIEYQTVSNSYQFTGLESGTSWNIKVLTMSKQRNVSNWSNVIPRDINSDSTPPPDPSGVSVSVGLSNALVTWTESNANDLAGYEVYAKETIGTPSGTADRKAIVSKTSALITLKPNTTYYFYVRAFDRTGNPSGFSSVVSATTSATLSSIGGNTGEIELGSVTILGNSSYIRSGQADFNTGQGFWLGQKSGVPKLSIGNSAGNYFTWDSSLGVIKIQGDLILGSNNNIKSGQNAFNTGTGFFLGRNNLGKTQFSIGDPNGNHLTYDETTGDLNLTGNLTVTPGDINYNSLEDRPALPAQSIGIKKNYINFTTEENGEAYIHGISNGYSADIDGKIVYAGIEYNIPKTALLTSVQNESGYILVDLSFSNRFTVSGSPVSIVFAKKVSGSSWKYDNNLNNWTSFTIGNNDLIIGKLKTSQNTTDLIDTCEIWQYGIRPDTSNTSNSLEGNEWGPGIIPPRVLSSPPITGSGLFANDKKIGFVQNGTWKTYMDNYGNFYLSGDGVNHSLAWDGSTLKIYGDVIIGAAPDGTGGVPADAIANGTYSVIIESTNGDVFRPGQPMSTYLVAHVFNNGEEVTDSIDASKFKWRRVSYYPMDPPNDDATWNALYATGYKQIMITTNTVESRATFHCDIIE